MANADTKRGPAEETRPAATHTRASSARETPTEPPPQAAGSKDSPPPDPMVAWLEERIATEQYLSPAWQAMTSALEFYRGLKANG